MAKYYPWVFLQRLWANRFGLDNLSIRTRLVLMVVLLITLFGLIATQAHRTIIAYIEKREKVDLRDEAMNVRASFEKLLNRAESLVIEHSRTRSEGSEVTSADDGLKVTFRAEFRDFDEFINQCGLDPNESKGASELDLSKIPRREVLEQIMNDHLFSSDKPQLHSYWSRLYWEPNPAANAPDKSCVKIQVLVRDDLNDRKSADGAKGNFNENMIWFYEVDLTERLSNAILSSVRSYGILVNPSYTKSEPNKESNTDPKSRRRQSMELAYLPIIDGSPSHLKSVRSVSSNEEAPRRFELGPKLVEAIHNYEEKLQQLPEGYEIENFTYQFPPNEDLPEGMQSKISLQDLIVGGDLDKLKTVPWTCKSSTFSPDLVKQLSQDLVADQTTQPSAKNPLLKVFIEKGQAPRFWLRASSNAELNRLKQTVSNIYQGVDRSGKGLESLTWESETSMGNLVLSVASIVPPGASPFSPPILYIVRAVSLEEIRNSAQEGLSSLFYWGVSIAVLSLLLTVGLAFLITQPLKKISQVVSQIQLTDINSDSSETEASFKKLLSDLPVGRKDEVGAIANQLSKTFESILEKNTKIRVQHERSNKADVERRVAEEANEAKTQFLAMISHDMRQSMAVIFGHLELLLDEPLLDGQKQDVQGVFVSAKKLRYLIDDVLDYQRFLTGDVHVESVEMQLEDVLKSVVGIYQSNAIENGNQLEFESYYHKAIVSDRNKIERIVGNLISNACKFTKKGKVSLVLEQVSASEVRIVVEDTGRGMSKEQQAKVFQIQNTVKNRGNRDGTGLGLYICDRLTKSLGGNIRFESVEGKGTRFEMRLPIQKNSNALIDGISDTDLLSEKPTLLIIDDSKESRVAISKAIESQAKDVFKIMEASTGRQGLQMAREFGPSVITLDVDMPELDGFHVLQELRSDPITTRIPVLMVTVHSDTGKASMLGASGFLKKPFDRIEIAREIDKLMRNSREGMVLVVDDEESCRKEMSRLLAAHGIRYATARDGEDALDRIKDEIPSLFIVDLLMPRMDGFALIEKLRSMPETKDVPILVLSALALDDDELGRLNPLVEKFFGKGTLDLNELVKEIDRVGNLKSKRNLIGQRQV